MERAGTRDTQVIVQAAEVAPGNIPGEAWADVGTFWVSAEVRPPERITRNGMSFDQEVARFRFDWMDATVLDRAMQIVFGPLRYDIKTIDRSTDTRKTTIVDAVAALSDSSALQESIERRIREGVIVTVVREDFDVDAVNVPARALVEGYQPDELVGGINQGDRRIIVLASDVLPSLPAGIKDGDTIILPDGEHLTALNVDAYTHRIGSNIIAYEMTGTGA